ncbi:MAG: hypothetical protein ACYC0A_08490 [Lutibacter sp.]
MRVYKDLVLVEHLESGVPRILEKYMDKTAMMGNCHHLPSLKFNDEN